MAARLTKEQKALLAIFGRLQKKDRVFFLAYAQAIHQKRQASRASTQAKKGGV